MKSLVFFLFPSFVQHIDFLLCIFIDLSFMILVFTIYFDIVVIILVVDVRIIQIMNTQPIFLLKEPFELSQQSQLVLLDITFNHLALQLHTFDLFIQLLVVFLLLFDFFDDFKLFFINDSFLNFLKYLAINTSWFLNSYFLSSFSLLISILDLIY